MKELNISYRIGLEHNYLIITEEVLYDDYQIQMLIHNKIKGFLGLQVSSNNDSYEYSYEISSMQPISRIFEHRQMSYDNISAIIRGISQAIKGAKEYLLGEDGLLLLPEYIYADVESLDISLVHFAPAKSPIKDGFKVLSEFILDKVDHQDNQAVMLAYDFFKVVKIDSFVLSDIERIIDNINQNVRADGGIKNTNQPTRESGVEKRNSFHADYEWNSDAVMQDEESIENKEYIKRENIKRDNKIKENKLSGKSLLSLFTRKDKKELNKKEIIKKEIIKKEFDIEDKGGYEVYNGEEYKREVDKEKWDKEKWDKGKLNKEKLDRREYNKEIQSEEFDRDNADSEVYGKTVLLSRDDDLQSSAAPRLVSIDGKKEYSLSNLPVTIGKSKELVDIVLKDNTVSRMHASILNEEGRISIKDIGSANGTYVNSVQVDDMAFPLEDSDEIMFGRARFIYYT